MVDLSSSASFNAVYRSVPFTLPRRFGFHKYRCSHAICLLKVQHLGYTKIVISSADNWVGQCNTETLKYEIPIDRQRYKGWGNDENVFRDNETMIHNLCAMYKFDNS